MSLRDDFGTATTDRIEKSTHHFSIYERYLASLVDRPCVAFLVIDGTSALAHARMWAKFLGGASRVVGLTDWEGDDHQVAFRRGTARDAFFRRRLLAEFGPPALVIEASSQPAEVVVETFQSLQPLQPAGGLYAIENIRAGYSDESGGVQNGSVASYVKSLIDELHAYWSNGAIPPNACSVGVSGIHVHPDLAIIERGQHADLRRVANTA